MSKRKDRTEPQLSLQLTEQPRKAHDAQQWERPKVISFVDSATQAIRQDAKDRVRAAGIFAMPTEPRAKG